jgi:putative transposase
MTFWSKYKKHISKQIWRPSNDNLSNINYRRLGALGTHRWFNITIQKNTNNQTCKYNPRQFKFNQIMTPEMEKANDDDKGLRTRKVKIYPTTQQKEILNKWFGGARWTYNKCVEYLKNSKNIMKYINIKDLRKLYVNKTCLKEFPFLKDSPRAIRDRAAKEFTIQHKTNRDKLANKKIDDFDMKFRSRKKSQEITIEMRDFKRKGGATFFLKHIKTKEPLFLKNIEYANVVNILKTELGEYYFTVIAKKQLRSDNQVSQFSKLGIDGVISLDPGVRTFMVGYDAHQRQIVNFGERAVDIIRDYNTKIAHMCRKMKNKHLRNKKKMRLRKRIQRLRKTLKNKVRDMHHRISKWLCENYKIILLPKFDVSGMTKKDKRVIGKETVKGMYGLCHYKFLQLLLQKARLYKNCKVMIVNEAYTSKTCCNCGKLNHTLGGSEIYKCEKNKGGCGLVIGRDANGARNIFIKNVQ